MQHKRIQHDPQVEKCRAKALLAKRRVLRIPLIVLLPLGIFTPALKSAFGTTFVWLSAGLFSGGLLSAGLFSFGIYSAGLFSIGIFSSGVFSVGIFSFGTYTVGIWSCGQYPVGVYTKQLESAKC